MADLISGLGDTIMDGIQAILYATIYKLLYYLAVGCCWVVNLLYSMFEIMAGLSKVSYDGNYDYLINVFFSNTTVSKVYWGMALIGLAVGFACAIAAVIKKIFDMGDKEKRSYGQILTALFRSVLIIVSMSLIITMVLNATTLLMQQVNYVFINADDLGEEQTITFTDEEYAAMARALNTIGNCSLNPSYNNRYNINKCFNEIRFDLQYLKQQGVFDFHYVTKDMEGNTIATWQSALQRIANSASLDRDLSLDVYHESVTNAILEAMDLLKVNGSFKPLEEYQRQYQPSRSSVPMDRLLFLMASMRAAKNSDYNVSPSLTDPLRGAYYYGEKSIYDLDSVNEDFDIGIAALDYVVLFLTCAKMLQILATIILNCVSRIFNMLLLYLISPLVVAVIPLDDGGKFKQWTTAFVVQSLSVFGTVISMRVILLFMPVITDSKLLLFDNPVANLLAKLVVILAGFEVVEKATALVTGILADNAGWQSITAGDMSGTAKSVVAQGKQMAKQYGMSALKTVGGAGLSTLGLGAKAVTGVGLGAGYGVYGLGKVTVAGGKALANKISAWRNSGGGDGGASAPDAGGVGGTAPESGGETLPENLSGGVMGGDSGAPVSADPSLAPETNVGSFQDRVKALEARMNPAAGGAQNVGPAQPLPQGIAPGIQSRVAALDAHMNGGKRSGQVHQNDVGGGQDRGAADMGGVPNNQAATQFAPQTDVGSFQDRVSALNAHMGGGAANQQTPRNDVGGVQDRGAADMGGVPNNQAATQFAPQTNVGSFQDRVSALNAHMGGGAASQQAPQTNVGNFQERLAAVAAHMNGEAVPTKAPPASVRNQQNNT